MSCYAPPRASSKAAFARSLVESRSGASVLCSPEATIAGKDDCLGARPYAELVEEVGHVVADSLFADGKALRDLRVAKAFCNQRQHLSLAGGERCERRILAARRALELHKLQHFIAEARPGRFGLKEDVVLRVELDELGARDSGGEDVPFCNRDDDVVARVQHQGRRRPLPEQRHDVNHSPRLNKSSRHLRRSCLAAEIVEPANLFIGSPGNEPRGEYLAKGGIIIAPSETGHLDDRPVHALLILVATAKHAPGVAAVE